MDFIPLNKRVLVDRADGDSKTHSGIIIPGGAKDKPSQGKVVAISNDGYDDLFLVGDEVIFGKYSGVETTVDGSEYLIVDKVDLLGVIKKG